MVKVFELIFFFFFVRRNVLSNKTNVVTDKIIPDRTIHNASKKKKIQGEILAYLISSVSWQKSEVCLLIFCRKEIKQRGMKMIFPLSLTQPWSYLFQLQLFHPAQPCSNAFSTQFFRKPGPTDQVSSCRYMRALPCPRYPQESGNIILLLSSGTAPSSHRQDTCGCPQLTPTSCGLQQEAFEKAQRKKLNIWSNQQNAEVSSWVMSSEVDGRWHPWISTGLALGALLVASKDCCTQCWPGVHSLSGYSLYSLLA